MKKIFLIAAVALLAAACEQKYDNWYSSAYKLSGEWVVKADYYEASTSTWEAAAPYGIVINTYSTAANVPTEIFIDDLSEGTRTFWNLKGKIKANAENATFGSATDTVVNLRYDSKFIVVDGQVLEGVGHSKTGVKTDSIVFVIRFDDDNPAWGTDYRISGHRKTGFTEDAY
ncbi:MAG: hypothetical protein LBK47_03575 [Prevotellaceae bacterium]|jgi:hypothetical protein|nr:hypothetical protein [Prevotellaceae bacterium]